MEHLPGTTTHGRDSEVRARVETLTQRPAFRGLLSHHHCLAPASGFYEWQGQGRDKTPYYIHPQDQQHLAFAGL
jgi:putative SOS response-associated peptidase YedK